MSDCQQWEPLDNSTMQQSADGGWVLIGDYSFVKREAYILRLTCQDLQSENARLQAELERLTELNATLSLRYDATKSMLDGCAKEIEEMEAQVERMTKAGDELGEWFMDIHPSKQKWNAAKEGKIG